eukprot:gnl/TRDRNA2_/TRDRNA2_90622_c0_seq1.p1 gnl/TRDRNA2_/TRDRNA2_90622_c0~~gnl/TRDRNA2_/TRDRNA2_90622_c0_seq1.p1  ORF type:complete len:205 (+),score=21.98 gnl/TRDRNA2_/TRDRNA2_90622_c0_seq1:103-717(+)
MLTSEDYQPGEAQINWAERWKEASAGDATTPGLPGREDLRGLLRMLDDLRDAGVFLIEVQHVVNIWNFAGFIPMQHHGLVFRTSMETFFSLDFGRKGIVWDTFPVRPMVPDQTVLDTSFPIHEEYADPMWVRNYCATTQNFSFFGNDCEAWTEGMLYELGCRDDGQLSIAESIDPENDIEGVITHFDVANAPRNKLGGHFMCYT